MNNCKTIAEWASLNRVSDNVDERGNLFRIAEDYGVTCPDVGGDCTLLELALHIQNGMLPVLRFCARPTECFTEVSGDFAFQQTTANRLQANADEGVSFRPGMVGRGDNTNPNGGQQISSENGSNEHHVGLSRQSGTTWGIIPYTRKWAKTLLGFHNRQLRNELGIIPIR